MIQAFRTGVFLAIASLVIGCKPADEKSGGPESDSAKRAQEMANMPGMNKKDESDTAGVADKDDDEKKTASSKIAKQITLSAAKIEHGGIKWNPVTMGLTAGVALLPGELVPNEDRTVRIGAPASGRVLRVLVNPGEQVRQGQPLVTLQSPEAGTAQAEVSKAVAALSAARAESEYASSARARSERLLALKAIPRQDYDRAITDDEKARAVLTQAEAEVQRARTTADQLSVGVSANGEMVLRAPMNGVVLARTAVPGSVIEAGAPLVTIMDASTMWLTINAPEPMVGMIRRGGSLAFTVPAYANDTLSARIESVGAGLDETTRTLLVRAVVGNAAGRLKPEMLANVLVRGEMNVPAVIIPEDAVQLIDGRPHAFVALPDGKGGAEFVRREVVVGSRLAGKAAVIKGLAAGELVVTSGAFSVKAEFQKAAMPKMEM